ncbi:MAG: hypothetical protein ACI4SO_03165 [Muribaculaceae bacterium]
MNSELKKILDSDTDGLVTYEYLANHIDSCEDIIDDLADNIIRVDKSGQFCASTARYLHAIDGEAFAAQITRLIASVIEKDREHRYLGDILQGIWGEDYASRAEELKASDDNFRRIYKRLYPTGF